MGRNRTAKAVLGPGLALGYDTFHSPNCVSSMADNADSEHYIEPFSYTGLSRKEAIEKMAEILEQEERCRIIRVDENYIHAEFRSKLFRFVDDAEFYFPQDEQVVQVKSASRLGYSDLGVNRKRIEHLREVFKSVN